MPRYLIQNEIKEDEPRHSCGCCRSEGCTDFIASFRSHKEYADCVDDWTTWNIYYCPNCNDINVEKTYVFSEDCYTDNDGNTIYNKKSNLLYPIGISDVPISPDLPKEMIDDYKEAQNVEGISPRSAAALLRLLLEKICRKYLLENEKIKGEEKLYDMIGIFVKEGILEQTQQACDILRITGNETIHAGELDIRDNPDNVKLLFKLVNTVAYGLRTLKTYKNISKEKLTAIKKRDR